MVMHARKVNRLDDGYRDIGQSDLLSKEKTLANSHFSKYDRKPSKFENFDNRRRSNSPRSFHSRSGHYDEKPRERRNYEENDGSSSKDSKSKEQKQKDHKYEVHRLAERVCGDWSEHVSKSGKRYFYNCRTEVSQWEKPEGWIEDSQIQSASGRASEKSQCDNSDRSKSSSSSKTNNNNESRHSSSGHNNNSNKMSSSKSSATSSRRNNDKDGRSSRRGDEAKTSSKNAVADAKGRGGGSPRDRNDRKRAYPRRSTSRSPAHSQKSAKYGSGGSSSEGGSGKNEYAAGNPVGGDERGRNVKRVDAEQVGQQLKELSGSSSTGGEKMSENATSMGHKKISPVHEDMDISPENSFSQHETNTRTSQDGLHSKSPLQSPSVKTSSTSTNSVENVARDGAPAHSTASTAQPLPLKSAPVSSVLVATTTATSVSHQASSRGGGTTVANPIQHPHDLQMTLAGLQQAVHRLTPDKVATSVSGQQSQSNSQNNFASCVALLPVLLAQLSSQQQSGSGSNSCENQLIIQQAIPLLKKLQEIVVHQQQQQQQQKLQQALLQLLQMQQNAAGGGAVQSGSNRMAAESPYSPPDSDGSPVSTLSHPHHHSYPPHHHRQQDGANKSSPRNLHHHQDLSQHQPGSRHNKQDRLAASQVSMENAEDRGARASAGSSGGAGAQSKNEKNDSRLPSSNPQSATSGGSQTPSQTAGSLFFRRPEIELTPGLVNHYDSRLIEHVVNWPADSYVKQAECIAADNYSYITPMCSQVSVELKQARSMVRAQEILSTRHEQRRIFIQHQLYEVDRGSAMPSIPPPSQTNPLFAALGQQQQLPVQHQQQLPVQHQQQLNVQPQLYQLPAQQVEVPLHHPAALVPLQAAPTAATSSAAQLSIPASQQPSPVPQQPQLLLPEELQTQPSQQPTLQEDPVVEESSASLVCASMDLT